MDAQMEKFYKIIQNRLITQDFLNSNLCLKSEIKELWK